jgi:hypothetical protein
MPTAASFARWCYRTASIAAFAALFCFGGLLPPAAAVEQPIPPPGYGRIWLYRDYEPYISLATPYVRFNGQIVGVSEPGGAFYRDVAPGQYYVTVDSIGQDVNQFVNLAVAAGQQVYVKVDASRYWDSGGGVRDEGWSRPTFYTRLQLPQTAAAEMAHTRFYGGS